MGLQDLLAVVLGVKTVEAIQERNAAKPGSISRMLMAEFEAERAESAAKRERLTPDWEAASKPVLDRLKGVPGFTGSTVPMAFGVLHVEPLYAAYLSGGSYKRYRSAFGESGGPSRTSRETFQENTQLLTMIQAADPRLFDELIDVYLGSPWSNFSTSIQGMREGFGLPRLARLPATKPCPRCAEMVKRAALACRFCGYEF